jgi:hypothetical protein
MVKNGARVESQVPDICFKLRVCLMRKFSVEEKNRNYCPIRIRWRAGNPTRIQLYEFCTLIVIGWKVAEGYCYDQDTYYR